jgi:hypothetical protein
MNAHTQMPPLDPFAPGVRAADVPVVKHDLSKVLFPDDGPTNIQLQGIAEAKDRSDILTATAGRCQWPIYHAPMVEFALCYARLGWHVFPCGRKAPLTACDKDADGNKIRGTGGFYKATTDEDQIRAWWKKWPSAMIGVRAGEASGVFAIDPDGEEGLANWAAIVAEHGDVPRTHMHLTPGGGQHLVFKWHADREVKCSSGQMKDLKIDVKGQGGYFIAPPSVGKNGRRYEVANPADFFNFAEAPEWLYELIVKKPAPEPELSITQQALAMVRPRDGFDEYADEVRRSGDGSGYIEAALRGEYDDVARATEGSKRNVKLNNSAVKLGHYVGGGLLDEKKVIDTLIDACAANGLLNRDGRDACLATIDSGMSFGKTQPKGIPERKPVPAPAHDNGQASDNAPIHGNVTIKPAPSLAIPLTYFNEVAKSSTKNHIIKDVIAKNEISRVIAPPGKGKSAFAIDLAIHVASGEDWRGYKSKLKCGVVYFALERGDLVKRRLRGHQLRDSLADLPIAVASRIINLMHPSCIDIIVATIREAEKMLGCSVGFMVLDVYPKGLAAGGGDENQAKDQGIALANLRRVQEIVEGIHIMNIGHTGKDETRGARGSNSQGGDDDMVIQITGDGSVKTAKIIKINDGEEKVITQFKMEVSEIGTDEDGDPITTAIVSLDDCGFNAGVQPKTKAKLSDTERRAMDLLYNALNDLGKDAPPAGGFPHGVKVVPVDTWRTCCKRGGLSKGEADSAFRTAFNRVSISLANKHKIGLLDDMGLGRLRLITSVNGARTNRHIPSHRFSVQCDGTCDSTFLQHSSILGKNVVKHPSFTVTDRHM